MERLILVAMFLAVCSLMGWAQIESAGKNVPFVVEYYYKTKWGHADEFLRLFRKNHYPS